MIKGMEPLTKPVFRYIIYCTDGKIFRHHVTTHGQGRAHGILEGFVAKGVTVYNMTTTVWTRISPQFINFIEMLEVKDNG